uniref:Uncharacterized protein n=1 Tax=Streptomyces sp. NBC_01401 TaxID=2903854 RepID=A0AAU3GZZ2_9ACTN
MSDSQRMEADAEAGDGTPGSGPRRRSLLARAGIIALVLAVPAGGLVWLFQDELFHPFGDARACDGSDAPLSGLLGPGGTSLPADASDVHYHTQNGRTEVSFLSGRIPDFLHRAGFVPDGTSPFDAEHDHRYAIGENETELPAGLCGPGARAPLVTYSGSAAEILVERSPFTADRFRAPARAIVTYNTP